MWQYSNLFIRTFDMANLVYCVGLTYLVVTITAFSNNPTEDASIKTIELIKKYGYPAEKHSVTTSDGYILEVHRIPHAPGKESDSLGPPVLVMHGLFCSSADWVDMGPGSSIGFLLADRGYDVWMGNARGNRYSRNHTQLNPDSGEEFWDFSWHEIGYYDIAATAEYMVNKTNYENVHFIGHSTGTTAVLVLLTSRPEYASMFKSIHLMAPVAYVTGEGNMFSYVPGLLDLLSYHLTPMEVFPNLNAVQSIVDSFCGVGSLTASLCSTILTTVGGLSNINTTMIPVILAHAPAGASTKQLSHFAQLIKHQKFRWYDFGVTRNHQKYGTPYPTSYNLTSISTPLNLYYSDGDTTAKASDVDRLYAELKNSPEPYLIEDGDFNHIDYVWGLNAEEQVWNAIITNMDAADPTQ